MNIDSNGSRKRKIDDVGGSAEDDEDDEQSNDSSDFGDDSSDFGVLSEKLRHQKTALEKHSKQILSDMVGRDVAMFYSTRELIMKTQRAIGRLEHDISMIGDLQSHNTTSTSGMFCIHRFYLFETELRVVSYQYSSYTYSRYCFYY
jgi:hypothetical protein